MPHIPDQTLDQIRDQSNIVEVVGSYFPLKKSGGTYKALCPFHQEKTPSFTVNPQKQTYHCFGCGVGGDVFGFVMKYENLEFPAAAMRLAERASIEIPNEPGASPVEYTKRDVMFNLHRKLTEFFIDNLRSPSGQVARQYLEKRKIPREVVEQYGLGYSLNEWTSAIQFLRKDFSPRDMVDSGVALPKEGFNGEISECYDRFRGRLMIPIHDEIGRIVGFSARILTDAKDQPKYVNSPETNIYHKGSILFGLNFARKSIKKTGRAVVQEGALDTMLSQSNDIPNSVAPCGSNFTDKQLELLQRIAPDLEVILMMDADNAGSDAALRISGELIGRGNIRIAALPQGQLKDPLDYYIAGKTVLPFTESSVSAFDFLYGAHSHEKDVKDIGVKQGLLKVLAAPLLKCPVHARSLMYDELARRLDLRPESVEKYVEEITEGDDEMAGKLIDQGVRRFSSRDDFRSRKWERLFVRQLLVDGRPETLRYYQTRDITRYLRKEEHLWLFKYMLESWRSRPAVLTTDPLFMNGNASETIRAVVDFASGQRVVLNDKYLWTLFKPSFEEREMERELRDRIFRRSGDAQNAKMILKAHQSPNLEMMEHSFCKLRIYRARSMFTHLAIKHGDERVMSLVEQIEKLEKMGVPIDADNKPDLL